MSAALELDGVTKRFGRVTAVDHLSMTVPEGARFGLIGPNGAGKTTTFGLLCGFLRPDEGAIRIRGAEVSPRTPRAGRLAALPQDAEMPPRLRAIEVLEMLGRFGGLSSAEAKDRGMQALTRLSLADAAHKRVGELSHGQRRRVGIAQALLGDDEIILLDEPTAGLDPRAAAELRALIAGLEGRTLILSSHNLAEVESLCDHAAILDRGRLVTAGSMAELRKASALVVIELAARLEAEHVLEQIRALPGVRRVDLDADLTTLHLELAAEDAGDPTNDVLRVLMDAKVAIGGVERGESLERRFLAETGGSGS